MAKANASPAPVSAVTVTAPTRHRVLYMRPEPAANWKPIASRVADDVDADEDFAALRVERINEARRAGAQRPAFQDQIEVNGNPETA
jgi:hypothetical protein